MKKKILSTLLAIVAALSLIACGNNEKVNNGNGNNDNFNNASFKTNYIGKVNDEPINSVSNVIPLDKRANSTTKYLVVTANLKDLGLANTNPVTTSSDYTTFYSLYHTDESMFTIEEYSIQQGPVFRIPKLVEGNDSVYVSFNYSKIKEKLDLNKAKTDIDYFVETLDSYNCYETVLASMYSNSEVKEHNGMYIIGSKYKDYYTYDVLKYMDDYLVNMHFSTNDITELNTDYVDKVSSIFSLDIKNSKDELDTSLVYYEDLIVKEMANKFGIYLKNPIYVSGIVLDDLFQYDIVDDDNNYITTYKASIENPDKDILSEEKINLLGEYSDYKIYNKESSATYWLVNKSNKYTIKIECIKSYCEDKDNNTMMKELIKHLLGTK